MNLICKLKRFMKLRAKGVPMKSALREFNHPLTATDKYALTLIACIVALCVTLAYKREIDDGLNLALQREAIANQKMYDYKTSSEYSDKVIASMLNGRFKLNGKLVTLCILDAAGGCK